MRRYNLFRRRDVEGLCCAVPESSAVPAFVTGAWTFGGQIGAGAGAPHDFDGRAADVGVRFNGYYVFQTVDRRFAR